MRAMRAIWYFDYDIRDTNYELRRVCHMLTHPPFIFGALKLGLWGVQPVSRILIFFD